MTRTPSPGVAWPLSAAQKEETEGLPSEEASRASATRPKPTSTVIRRIDSRAMWRNEKGTWALRRFSLNSPSPDNSLENHQANPNWGTFYMILNPRSSELSRSSKARDVWELSVSRGALEDVTTECDVTPGWGPGTWRGQRRKSEE